MRNARTIVWGLTAAFAAATYGFMADLGEVPDGDLFARTHDVHVLKGAPGFMHNGEYVKNDVVLTLPLDWEEKKQQTGVLELKPFFNVTQQDEIMPGMYRITTRGNFFPMMDLGPAMIVKADPLI